MPMSLQLALECPLPSPSPHPSLFPAQALSLSLTTSLPTPPLRSLLLPSASDTSAFPALIMIEVLSLHLTAQRSRPRQAPRPLVLLTQTAWFPPNAPQANHIAAARSLLDPMQTGSPEPMQSARAAVWESGRLPENINNNKAKCLEYLSTVRHSYVHCIDHFSTANQSCRAGINSFFREDNWAQND